MRLFSRDKPKIKIQTTKRDSFSGWLKCAHCKELIHAHELEQNLNCCPKCDHHYRLTAEERIESLVDRDTFEELFQELQPADPLHFQDTKKYQDRLAAAKEKSGQEEAIQVGKGKIQGKHVALAVLDFNFMGGSMGSVMGERLTRLIEYACKQVMPLVVISSSGGARMQESIFSLMQMAKTAAALSRLHQKGVPYISVLANPTTGGVTASFASLGDLIIAEPDALICFAGPRVIEQTIGHKLPDNAQKSEFLLNHGMIDCIVRRHKLRDTLAEFLELLEGNEKLVDGV